MPATSATAHLPSLRPCPPRRGPWYLAALALLCAASACNVPAPTGSVQQPLNQGPGYSILIRTALVADWAVHLDRNSPAPKGFACTSAGLFADPEDCGGFYQCILLDERAHEFEMVHFHCGPGTVFSEPSQMCTFPQDVAGCEDYPPPKF